MKQLFLLTFLIVILFNVVGYFAVFKVEQFEIKTEIESQIRLGISHEAFTIITVDKLDLSTIEWTESDKELRYKDNLYDVVRYTETNKTISYYCINDSEEESLFSSLTEHINIHVATNTTSKKSKNLQNHIIKLYFISSQRAVLPVTKTVTNLFPEEIIISTSILKKQTPPPELV